MKAVYICEFGGPEKVQVGECATPEPGPGEVRIRVRAAALNHLDVWVRRGRPGAALGQAHVLGREAVQRMESGIQFGKIALTV